MGNQQNSSDTDKKKEKKEILIYTKDQINASLTLSRNTSSSYKGVKTVAEFSNNDLEKEVKAELTTECQTLPDNMDLKEFKIPTVFEWKEGGNNVYITGSFSNWSQWFIMSKINNTFELNLVNFFLIFFK